MKIPLIVAVPVPSDVKFATLPKNDDTVSALLKVSQRSCDPAFQLGPTANDAAVARSALDDCVTGLLKAGAPLLLIAETLICVVPTLLSTVKAGMVVATDWMVNVVPEAPTTSIDVIRGGAGQTSRAGRLAAGIESLAHRRGVGGDRVTAASIESEGAPVAGQGGAGVGVESERQSATEQIERRQSRRSSNGSRRRVIIPDGLKAESGE